MGVIGGYLGMHCPQLRGVVGFDVFPLQGEGEAEIAGANRFESGVYGARVGVIAEGFNEVKRFSRALFYVARAQGFEMVMGCQGVPFLTAEYCAQLLG